MDSWTRAGLMVVLGLATIVATIAIETGGTQAQTATPPQQPHPRRHVPNITVVPLSRYHRQCDFWLAVEHRPAGDVITPQQHCWWTLK